MFEQTFKNIDDVLWKEAGCTTELDYTEQTSWILFLKYLDDLEQSRAMEAELVGKPYTFIIDDDHRWSKWAAPKNKDWFAYKFSDPQAVKVAVESLRRRVGIDFDARYDFDLGNVGLPNMGSINIGAAGFYETLDKSRANETSALVHVFEGKDSGNHLQRVRYRLVGTEIVAWLGLDDRRNDELAPPRRAESLGGGARHDRRVERPGEVRRAVSPARGLRAGMAV